MLGCCSYIEAKKACYNQVVEKCIHTFGETSARSMVWSVAKFNNPFLFLLQVEDKS